MLFCIKKHMSQERSIFLKVKRPPSTLCLQKVVLVTIWIVIQVPGNLMLFGLIHFDKFGGDPLKRRMIDQVKQSLMSLSFEEFVQITGLKNQNKIVKMEIVVY